MINYNLTENVKDYLQLRIKYELKYMYSFDVTSEVFGVETETYRVLKLLLTGITNSRLRELLNDNPAVYAELIRKLEVQDG